MKKRIYLDYAATTPVDPQVIEAMRPFWAEQFGNSMSLHSFGQQAKAALEEARKRVADLMGVKSSEIIFTSSATESNNMVLRGIKGPHIIISAIEHACIMETAEWLEKQGVKVTRMPVDKYGLVNPSDVERAITKDTVLVSIIASSNEIGTIQPIGEIGKICREKGVYFHTDAAQSFGKVPIDIENVDMLTASSHKMSGPKGAACLFVREGVKIEPLLQGGGQERGLRPSTVNVPAVVGFGRACEIVNQGNVVKLRDKIIENVLKIKGCHLTGHKEKRLPNSCSFYFDHIEGESIVLHLDLLGIAASTGSACSSDKLKPSHVLLAIGLKPEQAHGSLRVTLGRETTEEEVDYFLKVLPGVINKLREISPFK